MNKILTIPDIHGGNFWDKPINDSLIIVKIKPLQNSSYNLHISNIFLLLCSETGIILSKFCRYIPCQKKGHVDLLFTNKYCHQLGIYSCFNRNSLYKRL